MYIQYDRLIHNLVLSFENSVDLQKPADWDPQYFQFSLRVHYE